MPPLDLPAINARLRACHPLVQNITNTVVQQFSANVLLAIGAAPAMFDHPADAAQFARIADALLVNFGTATNGQLLAADAAIAAAAGAGKPWVLDPVSFGAGDFRTQRIRQVLARRPTVVRGNASEIMALAGTGAGARGVDATDAVEAALPAAVTLARQTGGVVAVSGATDLVVAILHGQVRVARIAGGSALMALVVGTGCALGSAVAAYLGAIEADRDAVGEARFDATVAAHAHFALAGSLAAERARSPGSFAVAFLDALYETKPADFSRAKIALETRDQP